MRVIGASRLMLRNVKKWGGMNLKLCDLCDAPPTNKQVKATHQYRDVDGMTYSTCDKCTQWIREVSDCKVWKIRTLHRKGDKIMSCPFKETCGVEVTNDSFIELCQSDKRHESCFHYPSQIVRKTPKEWDEK